MITVEYAIPSNAPCDSCGTTSVTTTMVTITLTNKKVDNGYKLPTFMLCDICENVWRQEVNRR
jgi:hypothetical protein